jgi:hypothetical protein
MLIFGNARVGLFWACSAGIVLPLSVVSWHDFTHGLEPLSDSCILMAGLWAPLLASGLYCNHLFYA